MTRNMFVGTVCLAALFGQQQVAQAATVAVVNVPVVSEGYHRTADLEAQFERKRQNLNQRRDALRDKIDRTARSLQEELKPGTEAFRARRKELAMAEAELQYFVEAEGREIERALAESLGIIFDDIHAMVRELAEEKGIDLVLAADRMPEGTPETPTQIRQQILWHKVLYWSPKIDLTEDVIERLNARFDAQRKKG